MSGYFWTSPEIRIVRDNYAKGVDACLALLPGRTRGSVYQQAAKQGLKCMPDKLGKPRRKYQTDMFTDQAIRAVYEATPKRLDVQRLAERIGRPRWWVSKRARQLGLTTPRFKEAVWTEEEFELLEQHAHKNLDVISRIFKKHGYSRSGTAIQNQRKRHALGVTASRQAAGMYSANQVATLMGVDAKTLTRWIQMGMIDATKRGTDRTAQQGGDEWVVRESAIRAFVATHPQSVDLRKVDKLWFIELMGRSAA